MWSVSFLLFTALIVFIATISTVVEAGTNEEGLAFLKANKEKEGVVELPSGLQYKILKSGSGLYHPGVSTSCSCHYAGRLIDGTEFDSSYGRGEPSDFAPNQVIKGWTEVMQLMVEGDKWELYIPSELGYGKDRAESRAEELEKRLMMAVYAQENRGGPLCKTTKNRAFP
jgi:FKBP-type peptidyl-prolyl cis-trans isomerase FklB